MTAMPGLDQAADTPEAPSAPATERRFLRSRTNRALAGVCGGIAEYYGSDVTAVRILTVVIAVFTGILPLLFVYLIAAVVVPDHLDGSVATAGSTAGVGAPTRGAGVVIGVFLVAIGVLALANEFLLVDWDVLWPFALVALGGGLIVVAYRR
jgi:phage shock protein PspC (stress-responsive transcriptional regulator)